MVSASSLAHFQAGKGAEKGMETVEIDPQLAEGLGFAAGDIVRDTHLSSHLLLTRVQVEIGLLHDLPYATAVSTEPLTADDWEILVCRMRLQSDTC